MDADEFYLAAENFYKLCMESDCRVRGCSIENPRCTFHIAAEQFGEVLKRWDQEP